MESITQCINTIPVKEHKHIQRQGFTNLRHQLNIPTHYIKEHNKKDTVL